MTLEQIILAVAAVIPAVILLVFIYKKDKVEKEPMSLLILLFVAGALTIIPALIAETIIAAPLTEVFGSFGYVQDNVTYLSGPAFYLYQFFSNFFGVALVEEGLKWIALYLITRNNKNFNSFFDGMIYAVCVSLGFALFENIQYVFSYGFITAILRAVTAVPGHMFFAVIMGMYYTQWNIFRKAHYIEQKIQSSGQSIAFKFANAKRYLILSIVCPVLAHGFYDFCASGDSLFFTIVFIVFVIILYVFCFNKINTLSKYDANADTLALALFIKFHPEYQSLYAEFAAAQNNGTATSL